ncbi:ImmA/IrrE family metallo-endopeptidase [Pseudomonas lundensis]
MLGHVREGRAPKRDTSFNNYNDPDEIAANAFAANLLMPEDLVRDLYGSARNVQDLAEAFGVSSVAMTYRLKNLGMI